MHPLNTMITPTQLLSNLTTQCQICLIFLTPDKQLTIEMSQLVKVLEDSYAKYLHTFRPSAGSVVIIQPFIIA